MTYVTLGPLQAMQYYVLNNRTHKQEHGVSSSPELGQLVLQPQLQTIDPSWSKLILGSKDNMLLGKESAKSATLTRTSSRIGNV